jgi:hypothetical protein
MARRVPHRLTDIDGALWIRERSRKQNRNLTRIRMTVPHQSDLLSPSRLWARNEILVRDCPVPREPGVYAWYFRELPPGVPTTGCHTARGATLLYVGISPRRPPDNGTPPSRQSLRSRIRYHFRGNAAGSTLRLTLGCLLRAELETELLRVGSGERYTFADKEGALSAWMDRSALVVWTPSSAPWDLEEELIKSISLPLNLDRNRQHAFHHSLSASRREARQRADDLPVWQRTR